MDKVIIKNVVCAILSVFIMALGITVSLIGILNDYAFWDFLGFIVIMPFAFIPASQYKNKQQRAKLRESAEA